MKRSSPFRSVSGVIATFVSFVIAYYAGGIVFYRIYDTLDASSMSGAWLTVFDATYQFFSLGLTMFMFILILCIIIPLAWIFMGRGGGYRV
jgi:hypothetical protein